jgi:hypothetical protein
LIDRLMLNQPLTVDAHVAQVDRGSGRRSTRAYDQNAGNDADSNRDPGRGRS